jgi:hypothetical protein
MYPESLRTLATLGHKGEEIRPRGEFSRAPKREIEERRLCRGRYLEPDRGGRPVRAALGPSDRQHHGHRYQRTHQRPEQHLPPLGIDSGSSADVSTITFRSKSGR